MSTAGKARPALEQDADLSVLEADRDFLIRSLKDLDAEHDAGDLDPADHSRLKDDYTARAASVLRAIEVAKSPSSGGSGDPSNSSSTGAGSPRVSGSRRPAAAGGQPVSGSGRPTGSPPGPPGQPSAGSYDPALLRRRRRRSAAVAAAVVAFAAVAAWSVTQSTGSRLAGQSVSGDNRALSSPTTKARGAATPVSPDPVDQRLVSAAQLVNQGKVAEALQLYDAVLKDNPNQPVALANDGWLLAQAGLAGAGANLVDTGLAKITQSEKLDASYSAVHFFRGFLLLRAKSDPAGAVTEFRTYLGAVDPSSPEVPQVERLLAEAIKAAGPTVPAGPNAPAATTAPARP
jgi:hypothetical protein